jgi:hypothetical protein
MNIRWTIALGAVLVSLAGHPVAARAVTGAPFDFTGHWTGVGQETGAPEAMLTGDFVTGDHPRLFVGSLTVEQTPDPPLACSVKGKLKGAQKVKIHFSCSGATIRAHGLLDQTARSVTGTFTRRGRNRVHHGTFTLTEQPSA